MLYLPGVYCASCSLVCWFIGGNNNNNNNINNNKSQPNENSDAKQDGIQHIKARLGESLKKKWKNKVLHRQYIRNIDRQLINEEDTFLRLSKGDLKAETESEIVEAQDQTNKQNITRQKY